MSQCTKTKNNKGPFITGHKKNKTNRNLPFKDDNTRNPTEIPEKTRNKKIQIGPPDNKKILANLKKH